MIIFTDLHLSEASASVVFDEVLPGIRHACVQLGDYDVAFLGDWWHVRNRLPVKLLNGTTEELNRWEEAGINLRILPGNHDQVDVEGRNALEVFNEWARVTVYTYPVADDWGLWVPYRKSVDDLVEMMRDRHTQHPRVLGHFGVTGAAMGADIYDKDGVPLEALAPWGQVLLGHYHKRQQLGNVQYIGSPWQTRSDESGQAKGFAQLLPTGELTYYDTNWGPKHFVMHVSKGQAVDPGGMGPRDVVRVHAAHDVDVQQLGSTLALMGVGAHTITQEAAPLVARLQIPERESGAVPTFTEYAHAYAHANPCGVPEEQLLSVFAEIVGQS